MVIPRSASKAARSGPTPSGTSPDCSARRSWSPLRERIQPRIRVFRACNFLAIRRLHHVVFKGVAVSRLSVVLRLEMAFFWTPQVGFVAPRALSWLLLRPPLRGLFFGACRSTSAARKRPARRASDGRLGRKRAHRGGVWLMQGRTAALAVIWMSPARAKSIL